MGLHSLIGCLLLNGLDRSAPGSAHGIHTTLESRFPSSDSRRSFGSSNSRCGGFHVLSLNSLRCIPVSVMLRSVKHAASLEGDLCPPHLHLRTGPSALLGPSSRLS